MSKVLNEKRECEFCKKVYEWNGYYLKGYLDNIFAPLATYSKNFNHIIRKDYNGNVKFEISTRCPYCQKNNIQIRENL